MAKRILPDVEDVLSYIIEAIDSTRGAEISSPVHMSVNEKDIEENPDTTKTVLFKSKIHVDKGQRTKVRDDVTDYLNNLLDTKTTLPFKQVIVGTKTKPDADQFDVVVDRNNPKPQVIRILVKPTSAGGSGGGAAKTKIQEVGQAVFAAIRYIEGKDLECHVSDPKKCLDSDDYKKGMAKVDCNNEVTVDEIMGLEQSWKDAFILGANKIAKEVGGSDWEFVRGDKKVEDAISRAFNRCKKSPGAPVNEDKWNPSDIWMVKNKTKVVEELNKENTIDCLNNFISQAFSETAIKNKSGKDVPPRSLVGLSLKKLGTSARWDTMNEVGKTQLQKAGKVKFQKQNSLNELTAFSGMDVYLVYTSEGNKTKDSFQARNFGGEKKGDWKLELKGEFAAQGKIQGDVMRKLLRAAKFKSVPTEPKFDACGDNASVQVRQAITNEIYKRLKGKNPRGWMTNETSAKAEIRSKSASWRYSKLCGLRFLDWLIGINGEADRAMKEIYLYASSQTDKSSVHYKLY